MVVSRSLFSRALDVSFSAAMICWRCAGSRPYLNTARFVPNSRWACLHVRMVSGTRRVEVVPHDQVAELEPLVQRWREHFDALRELGAINAQLLRLWRQEQRERS